MLPIYTPALGRAGATRSARKARIDRERKEPGVRKLCHLMPLALLLAAGCWFNFHEAEEPETKSWSAAAVDTVDIHTPNGAVTVTAGPDTVLSAVITRRCLGTSESEAREHLPDITVTDSISGRTLWLDATVPLPNDRSSAADFALTAPAATILRIVDDNGQVKLVNTAAFADVRAANGRIYVEDHRGSIRLVANNGLVDCDIAALAVGDTASIHSDNGAATLKLPADVSANFVASAANGSVLVEGFSDILYEVNEPRTKVGVIGWGGAMASVSSSNGLVTLKAR